MACASQPLGLAAAWGLNPLHWLLLRAMARSLARLRSFLKNKGIAAYVERKGRAVLLPLCLYAACLCLDPCPNSGGYPLGLHTQLLRRAPWWRWLARSFPMKLGRTPVLDATQKYIFVCHPHGILGFGTWLNFGMDATSAAERFPGVRWHLLGASAWFWIPVVRELSMLHGFGSVQREGVLKVLHSGHSVVINVGGAREALDAEPGTFRLQLGRRHGFVRCALETGAHLVPVISFGENDLYSLYKPPPGSLLRRVQDWAVSLTGSTLPLFSGRWWLPAVPRRTPVVTVVGEPIRVRQNCEATQGDVEELHQRYVGAMRALFESQKVECGFPDLQLELL